MPSEVVEHRGSGPVIQFSVFADNKVGRLHELICDLHKEGLHVLALTLVDTTETTVMRMIVNYPEKARELFRKTNRAFCESELLVVRVNSEGDVRKVTQALVEAEINIHYLYPFVCTLHGKGALALSLEDYDLANSVLAACGLETLGQADLAR